MEKCQGLVLSSSSSVGPAFTADEFNRHIVGSDVRGDSPSTRSNMDCCNLSRSSSLGPRVTPGLQFSFRIVDL